MSGHIHTPILAMTLAMMASKADFFRYVLERPVATTPGTKFVYNSGVSLMLGEIIYKASGLRADKFAERHLFSPLGITNYFWGKAPNGVVNTLGGLALRPRDMAKIGQLFLNGGRWQEKQIVSEKWVKESTKQQIGASQLPAWFSSRWIWLSMVARFISCARSNH